MIELPPDVLGILDDMYFRYITDMGAAGPDKGKGGKYLVLPPGYDGDVPEDGYYVVQSRTYTVWNFMRGYVRDSVKDAADNIKNNLKVYPLAQKDNPPKMEFLNMSGLAEYQTIPPNDFSFFEDLNAIIQEEPLDFIGPETRGQIAAIGIVKGQPFQPMEGCGGCSARRQTSATPMPAPTPSSRAIRGTATIPTPTASGSWPLQTTIPTS